MQVDSIISNSYVPYEQKVQPNNSSVKFDTSKPFNIKTFSFEDYKNITAEELAKWTSSTVNSEEASMAGYLNGIASHTSDDIMNEILFNKAKEAYDNENPADLMRSVFLPLADMRDHIMHKGERVHMEALDEEIAKRNPKNFEIHPDKYALIRNKTFYETIDTFVGDLKKLPSFYENNKSAQSLWDDDVLSIVDNLLTKYENKKNEEKASLDSFTKNTKPDILYI